MHWVICINIFEPLLSEEARSAYLASHIVAGMKIVHYTEDKFADTWDLTGCRIKSTLGLEEVTEKAEEYLK